MRSAALTLPGALMLAILLAGDAEAQYREVVLDPDPQARVFALTFRFPFGTAQDPVGGEGAAFLLGRVLERQGNRVFGQHGATLGIEVGSEEFLFSMVSAPSRWRETMIAMEGLLYREVLSAAVLEAARGELLDVLAFESGAPVRAFEVERGNLLLGPGHPGARPPQGRPTTIESLGIGDLEALRSLHLRAQEGVVAATGPVRADELSAMLSTVVRDLEAERGRGLSPTRALEPTDPVSAGDSSVPRPRQGATDEATPLPPPPVLRLHGTTSPVLEVPPEPRDPPAWTTGERVVLDRELTSTWISVAFPFPPGTPTRLLDFLGHLLIEGLTPSPPDPGLFEAQVSQVVVRDAPVLVVTASVDPRATSRWEERLRGSLGQLAEEPPAGAFFELTRRRFRSSVLIESAIPENRSMWLAREVASEGDPAADLEALVWGLRRPAVSAAAAAAGPPRTILFGPQDMMDR